MSFIVDPLALVYVTISVDKLSLAIRFVSPPEAFIPASIWPHLATKAISLSYQPLTCVDGSVFESNWPSCNSPVSIYFFALLSQKLASSLSSSSEMSVILESVVKLVVLHTGASKLVIVDTVLQLTVIECFNLCRLISAGIAILSAASHFKLRKKYIFKL